MWGMKNKERVELITGLDVGSNAVRVVVGQQIWRSSNDWDLQIVGAVSVPSEGVVKGSVSSIEECVSSISNALEQTERLIGIPVEHAWVGISGTHIAVQESRGVVAVAKANGEIGAEDVVRVVNAAGTVSIPLNYEILHVLPHSYVVDGQTGIKDPVGMTGIRLEVNTKIIMGLAQQINNLTKTVYRTGIDIDDLVLSILAVSDSVLTARQKELGVAVVNIGSSTTGLTVFEGGDLLHAVVLPIGSEYITNDLAIGLKCPIEVAKRVKKEYGHCLPKSFNRREKIDLATVGLDIREEVELRDIAEIINARVEEILEKINQELSKIGRVGLLPAGVIFTGAGAKLSGLVELAKEKMGLSASLGYPFNLQSATDKINDLSFSTAIGLVKWGATFEQRAGHRSRRFKAVDTISKQVKGWFKSLIP